MAIGGGTQTYNAFLEKDLITEMFLNIVPIVSGAGGIIGNSENLLSGFKLAGHKLMTDDIIQLHFIR